MNRLGLWPKGVAFALILSMVFLAASISARTVEADDPYYTYGYDEMFAPVLERGGDGASFYLNIGINWGDATPRDVYTTMYPIFICPDYGEDHINISFDPLVFTLGINQTQPVEVTVSAKETAEGNNYIIEIWAIDLDEHSITSFSSNPDNWCRINPLVLPEGAEEGCFIATAAYGTSTAAEIDTLRAFRDDVLLESTLGSRLVEWYYQTSPPVADFISEHEGLRTLVRELFVEPVAWVVEATKAIWCD